LERWGAHVAKIVVEALSHHETTLPRVA